MRWWFAVLPLAIACKGQEATPSIAHVAPSSRAFVDAVSTRGAGASSDDAEIAPLEEHKRDDATATDGASANNDATATDGASADTDANSAGGLGTVCFEKLPSATAFRSEGKGSASVGYDDTPEARAARMRAKHVLEMRVDGMEAALVSQDHGVCVGRVPQSGRHAVKIFRSGRQVFSVVIDFAKGAVAYLRYEPFYAQFHLSYGPRIDGGEP